MTADPSEYIRQRCAEHGIDPAELLSGAQRRPVAQLRHQLCVELNREFGLGAERIGRLLGGRDPTTVAAAWRKLGHRAPQSGKRRALTADEIRRIFALHADGIAAADIARAIGRNHATVVPLLFPEVKARRRRKRRETRLLKVAMNERLRARYARLDSHA